jgi:hypothetical protein
MTLITQTIHHGAPFIIGEIVFSSRKGNSKISYPTSIGPIDDYTHELLYKPYEYWQKIYIITNNLCIGLVGDAWEMQQFLEEIRQQCRFFDSMNFENLMPILDQYDMEGMFADSEFLACLITKEGEGWDVKTVTYPKHSWKKQETFLFERNTVAGSGKDDFNRSEGNRFLFCQSP